MAIQTIIPAAMSSAMRMWTFSWPYSSMIRKFLGLHIKSVAFRCQVLGMMQSTVYEEGQG